ncbi:MAG: SDR family oxidoreductase [Thermoflexales bacterium]
MKTILITGATDGIGKATALALAQQGHLVIVHGRTTAKARAVVDELHAAVRSEDIDYVAGDFSRLSDVRALANEVIERHPGLDTLVNNAGVYMNTRELSADGFELTLAVNHLAPYLLTRLLLSGLKLSAPARIVNVSSTVHMRGKIDFDELNSARAYSPYGAYAASKLANVLFSNALARRLAPAGVTSNALHPGVISTKLLMAGFNTTGAETTRGAQTSVFLASAPEVEGLTGRYFDDRREKLASESARDEALQERLWRVSAEMVGLMEE